MTRVLLHLIRKELMEIGRTWRLPTVCGVLLFFAILSPLAALAAPALLSSLSSGQPGVVIKIPDPTYLDSYLQWIKNVSQIGTLIVVFASAGLIANERISGTAVLVVSKPVSRHSFVIAKFIAQSALVIGSTVVGTAAVWLGTVLAFGTAPLGPLVAASAAWLAGALVAIALAEAFSAVLPTLAAGVGVLVAWALAGIVTIWEPASRYTPIGLLGAPSALLAGEDVALGWPLAAAATFVAAVVAAAGWLFARREL